MNLSSYPLLSKIESPSDLKKLSESQLTELAHELREYLLDSVSQTSGHLASGLGVVDLTIALHYVFDAPKDHLIWDVGHQAYPHKILTGRRDKMNTIRKRDGLHPFPWRFESDYDVASVGHSSTSISLALGLAVVEEQKAHNQNYHANKSIAIIGDGALTAGMAFEALNQAGELKTNLLVICNDNEMSISQNVGGLNRHLTKILLSQTYNHFRENSKKILEHFSPIKQLLKKTEHQLKSFISPSAFVEELGFNYTGPVDGHNMDELIAVLSHLKDASGPQFLHIKTQKGKGYAPAERDPIRWHGVSTFDKKQGKFLKEEQSLTYSKLFGRWICKKAKEDQKIIAITPAMKEGSGLAAFAEQFPERFYDVGIAEQHAVTFAAGLALGDMKPIVAIYSTFLQRAYDQVIHDIALQKLPVLFAIDRAGIVGEDGPTHQGAFDLSFLSVIPDLIIMVPSSGFELIKMLNTAMSINKPVAIRYPKGNVEDMHDIDLNSEIEVGQSQLIHQGEKIAILNFGTLLTDITKMAKDLNATLIDMRFVKPLDKTCILSLSELHSYVITIEENSIIGGAGSLVNQVILDHQLNLKILNIGFPDEFIAQGSQKEVKNNLGLDALSIKNKIHQFIREDV